VNKNLKKITAIALAFGMLSAAAPVSRINFLDLKAYAASDNTIDNLSSLELETSGGSSINLYSDSSYTTEVSSSNVSDGGQYYAESSSRTVRINISGPDSEYVKVFKDTSSSTEGKSVGDSISLSSGTNTIVVRVYDTTTSTNIRYSSNSHVVSEYRIRVRYSSSSDNNDDQFDSLKLENTNGDSLRLYDDDSYDSDEKVDSSDVEPDTDYYAKTSDNTVQIHISGVSSKYVRVFKGKDYDDISDSAKGKMVGDDLGLSSGINTLVVRIYDQEPDDNVKYEDDGDAVNDYTIYVDCTGDGASNSDSSTDGIYSNSNSTSYDFNTATSTPDTATIVSVVKTGWQQVNGRWQYNDNLGKTLINQWLFDRDYQKWYYLGSDGFMAENCWILSRGKYYYLTSDGSMATNTIINGYRVGADGACIR
jgi:hypothetical protein